MSELVERIAKTIYESDLFQPALADDPWDGEPSATKIFCRLAARDVLMAMREPTEAMLKAGDSPCYLTWQEMIDAALDPVNNPKK